MKRSVSRLPFLPRLIAASLALIGVGAISGLGSGFGRLSGTVKDANGNPLMGATVVLAGSGLPESRAVNKAVENALTDANGRFTIEHLSPGWYSVRVSSVTRLPYLRRGVRISAGQTSHLDLSLNGILSPLQVHLPDGDITKWGDGWKWVLRTSAATRPVLRYRDARDSRAGKNSQQPKRKRPAPPSETLVGMMPGTGSYGSLGVDPGMGSVVAYLRPFSVSSDLLVAASTPAGSLLGPSLMTAFRSNLLTGDPQEVALVVHQLNLSGSGPGHAAPGIGRGQGVVLSFSQGRRLTDRLSLTAGFEVDDLNASRNVISSRPRAKLEYQASPSTRVSVFYGTPPPDNDPALLDRVGDLNAFPNVSLKNGRLQLASDNHGEVAVSHDLDKNSRVEFAAYQDSFGNATVWASGGPGVLAALAGNVLADPATNGLTLNAGDYGSMGFRAAYMRRVGDYLETVVMYSSGDALSESQKNPDAANFEQALHPQRTGVVGAKVRAWVPRVKTRVTTSYEWLPQGRVTSVDPYGESDLEIHPFLNMEIRQPIPNIPFIPAHITAIADFHNLLAQGYVPVCRPGEEPLLLSSAYRSFRGGFSVQF